MPYYYPLPIPHDERQTPCDFLPDVPDASGNGERAWEIFRELRVTQGPLAGKTFGKTDCAWQEKLVRTIYGPETDDGVRWFRECLIFCAKKSGKSSLSAALAITHALVDPQPRGTIIVLAATKYQARLVWDTLAATIQADAYLAARFKVQEYLHRIIDQENDTKIVPVAAELAAVTGSAPTAYIVDEIHLLGAQAKGLALVEQLRKGTATASSPLGVYITTAPIPPAQSTGVYADLMRRARAVVAGDVSKDNRFLPVLYEMPKDTSPDDESLWWMANPSLGVILTHEYLQSEHAIAVEDPSGKKLEDFRSQHLNIEQGESSQIEKWLSIDEFKACEIVATLDEILAQSMSITIGLDAGGLDDMTSLHVIGQDIDGKKRAYNRQWLTKSGVERRKTDNDYREYIAAGELVVVDRIGDDLTEAKRLVKQIHSSGVLAGVGMDPHGLAGLSNALESEGVKVCGVSQGWKLGAYLEAAEREIAGGTLMHAASGLMRWNIGNTRVQVRAGNRSVHKQDGYDSGLGAEKIDGTISLLCGYAAMLELPSVVSVYMARGIRVL